MSMFNQSRVVRYFSSIAVANNFDVEIFVGKAQGLEVKTKGDFLPRIITEVNSFGKLFIHMEDGFSHPNRSHIIIHTHILNSLFIRDTVQASVLDLHGGSFVFEGTDASSCYMSGFIDSFKVTAFGSAQINAVELEAQSIAVSCNHSSQVSLCAKQTLVGTAYGNCNIRYKGKPSVDIFNSGQSRIDSY
ncbi:GIN domain-containing protein [Fluviispira multicolorata]|uniref:Putative auto-transporter adhesin head GIN domain-containing protein n=1 Tax=Fluviispira multicolorata TaxID=2654512 RepID=A0A833N3G4_9BACT|nr:DUF2807 domain-containing protein [Fluviispira multicolorata]KAB8028503.1 hypothetical protein GCL57_12320 [Fluviispira multicolorata]